jgi:poly(hydroxyalkanoate) depolymerase family esterase
MDFSKFWQAVWQRYGRVGAESAATARVAPAESRVGPRAAAWVAGRAEEGSYVSAAHGAFAAMTLNYRLYLPPSAARAARKPPLVVMLHGCRQSSAAFARGTRMDVLADRYGYAVLYPDQTLQRHAHGCWHWYDPSPKAGGLEAHAIAGLVAETVASRGLDPSRVYLAGLSAGAGMAGLLACQYPELFAAVALHSGPVHGAARSAASALDVMRRGASGEPRAAVPDGFPGMPALLLHGGRDDVVDPLNLEQSRQFWLAANGMLDADGRLAAGCDTIEFSGPAEARMQVFRRAGCVMVQTCLVPDLGHAWSGGDDTVPFHAALGPDASRLAWLFFDTHCRRATPRPVAAEPVADAV